MATVEETVEIAASPEEVWSLAGEPGRIAEWVPALNASESDGSERACTLANGAELRERILAHSDAERYYAYEIAEGPMPVSSYRSQLSVEGHGDHSHVHWIAEFEPESAEQEAELVETFGGIYRNGLNSLRELVEARTAA